MKAEKKHNHSPRNLRVFFLVLFFAIFVSGCSSLDHKKTQQQDRFEKWRIKAKESRGQTPEPRDRTLELETQSKQKEKPGKKSPGFVSDSETESADDTTPPPSEDPKKKQLPRIPVTLKMHDVSVPVLLRALARAADMNMMINETVSGRAKINIQNVPWDQAFTGLLDTYSLTYKWNGDIIRVMTVKDLNRNIALMEAQQKFEKSRKEHSIAMSSINRQEKRLAPMVTRIVKIDYADLETLRTNLEAYLRVNQKNIDIRGDISSPDDAAEKNSRTKGKILMDENSSTLIIQATKPDIAKLMPIIQRLDRPTKQIRIEAHIVEANSDTAKELGIQWGGLGKHTSGDKNYWAGSGMDNISGSVTDSDGNSVTHTPSIGPNVNFPSSSSAMDAGWQGATFGLMYEKIGEHLLYTQLSALEEEGKLNILSKPSITTMDHRTAIIESGKEVPFQTVEEGEVSVEFKKAVIKLEVIPHVVDEKTLRLEILTHKDELDWSQTVAGNPTIITKNAETNVILFDGQTTVIGGLNKEKLIQSEAGVPLLKDIPAVGQLFRNNRNSSDMEELLIFITPHILNTKGDGSG